MMNKNIIFVSIIAVVMLMMSLPEEAYAQKKSKQQDELSEQEIIKRKSAFMEANKDKILGNPDKAAINYKKVLEIDPEHDASMYELARIYLWEGRAEDAILLMETAIQLDPENEWYQLFIAELYKNTGQFEKVVEVFQTLIQYHPEKYDYYYDLALSYIILGEFNKAVDTYNDFEKLVGVNENISLQKQKLYLNMDKPKKALEEIEKLVDKNPSNSRYLQILAESYLSVGEDKKALETYQKIAAIDPENPYIHISLSDYYRQAGDEQMAYEELKLGFANPSLDIDSKVQILLTYYSIDQFYKDKKEQSFELTKILAQTHPESTKAQAIYGDLLFRDGQSEEAYKVFLGVVKTDKSNYSVWEQIMFIQNEMTKTDDLVKTSSEVMELFPMQPLPYLFNGFANSQKKNYEMALRSLETGSKLVVDNNLLLAQFYSSIGDNYNLLKDYEKSDESYDKALKINPLDAYVLNNYSYYLSLRNKNLDKALEMAQQAKEIDPDNPSFQDTYGWVLYKLGEYTEAEKWIKKAIGHEEDDSAILLEHYGDVLYKLGRTDEALQYWQMAKDNGGEASEFLDKKLKNKKIYE
jgi:tetratricopeptide (TPR) repeat protein